MSWFRPNHEWSKWTSREQQMSSIIIRGPAAGEKTQYMETWQSRTCEKCGKTQDEKVRGSR